MRSVELSGATDFEGFRAAARKLLAADVAPEHVSWGTLNETETLFGDDGEASAAARASHGAATTFKVPRAFVELARTVALHRDPARFALLYRLLWRLRAEPRLLALAVDEDVARARAWQKAVDRDIHKMHAYVRFREVPGVEPRVFVAWFEPTHHIVEEATPFFVRRFPNAAWTILTPEVSAIWDLQELRFGPGGQRSDAPTDDAAEDLWRNYYRSIFNPARLKVHAMLGHMPKKYWRNLPESAAIPELIRAAEQRAQSMIEAPSTEPAKHHRSTANFAARRPRPPVQHALSPGDAPEPIPALAERASRCRGCDLWRHATQTVFGEGPPTARVIFVGEQPGDQEDIAGKPFVGPAGRLLERALREAGIDRERVYVTNAVKHFKFELRGKRRLHKTPSQQEALACRSWLTRELEAIRPRLVVALGATAARSLLGKNVAVQRNRGQIIANEQLAGGRLLITVHPSYLLRVPAEQRESEYREFVRDLARAAEYLDPDGA